jgi:hypothetical protein
MPVHDGGGKKQESSLELSVFLRAMQNASPLLAVSRTGASATATIGSHHRIDAVATRARASAAVASAPAPATTCNGFRRVDRVGCELIKY